VKEWLRNLSLSSEVTVVLLLAFGLSIPVSLAALFGGLPAPSIKITDPALIATAIFELIILGTLAPFLALRGWTLQRLGITASLRDSLIGLALAGLAYLVFALLEVAVEALWPQVAQSVSGQLVSPDISWGSVALICLVNPLFEELFLCGYLIGALRERLGVTAAINLSAGIRVFCHFYQGAIGVLGIVPLALLFAYWFARTGRLWPLIIAHAALDLTALLIDR